MSPDDIVVVPAFGTTLEIQSDLEKRGINPYRFDTTCPFVEKVWKKGIELGEKGYSNVIHGKYNHEETRATLSHVSKAGPAVVILDLEEANFLASVIRGTQSVQAFQDRLGSKATPGFNPETDLQKFGVINQTTMLATETKSIMEVLKQAVTDRWGTAEVRMHWADTADTLCYATNENQTATLSALDHPADVAFVVGGYNSSNTSHLVELCEHRMPTYFIKDRTEIRSETRIHHFDWRNKTLQETAGWLPVKNRIPTFLMNSGASCPDSTLDGVILRLLDFFPEHAKPEEVLARLADQKPVAEAGGPV